MHEQLQFLYSFFGLMIGAVFMAGGICLFLRGVLKSGGSKVQIGPFHFSGTAPGLGFAFLGFAVIYFTRFS
jgi:hypothetical protein